jgi:hypothetical protein
VISWQLVSQMKQISSQWSNRQWGMRSDLLRCQSYHCCKRTGCCWSSILHFHKGNWSRVIPRP